MNAIPQRTNGLLARLPRRDRARFLKACSPVELVYGERLVEAGGEISRVYLPTSGFLSILRPIDGHMIEVSLAGFEGMFGWSLALKSEVSEVVALVQGAGMALSLTPEEFGGQMRLSSELRDIVARYTNVLMTQFAQTAGCNRFHVVEKRLARWLLTSADRAQAPYFRVTHEFLASMLGVRRAGVTQAAGSLQAAGYIRYQRGEIFIKNRVALEQAACSCYRINAATYERLMGVEAETTAAPSNTSVKLLAAKTSAPALPRAERREVR